MQSMKKRAFFTVLSKVSLFHLCYSEQLMLTSLELAVLFSIQLLAITSVSKMATQAKSLYFIHFVLVLALTLKWYTPVTLKFPFSLKMYPHTLFSMTALAFKGRRSENRVSSQASAMAMPLWNSSRILKGQVPFPLLLHTLCSPNLEAAFCRSFEAA